MKMIFLDGPRGPYHAAYPSRKARWYTRYIPVRGWQPIMGCEYEVEVVKELPPTRRYSLMVVKATNLAADEGAFHAALEEQKLKEEADREAAKAEAKSREASKAFVTKMDSLRSQLPHRVLDFHGFPWSAIEDGKRYGLSEWEESKMQEQFAFFSNLSDEDIAQTESTLSEFSAQVAEREDSLQIPRLAKEWGDLSGKVSEMKQQSLVREIEYEGKTRKVTLDLREEKSVYGTYTTRWAESPDGYRPAGSATHRGWHMVWKEIEDPELIQAVTKQFGDRLPSLIQKMETAWNSTQEAEAKRREIIKEVWDEIVVSSENKKIAKRAKDTVDDAWQFV